MKIKFRLLRQDEQKSAVNSVGIKEYSKPDDNCKLKGNSFDLN